jgi:hypothetical protein
MCADPELPLLPCVTVIDEYLPHHPKVPFAVDFLPRRDASGQLLGHAEFFESCFAPELPESPMV